VHRNIVFIFQLEVWKGIDEEKLRSDLDRLLVSGITSLAVVLMHSYM